MQIRAHQQKQHVDPPAAVLLLISIQTANLDLKLSKKWSWKNNLILCHSFLSYDLQWVKMEK